MPLSREQMIETINGGGSVLVSVGGKKRLVSSVEKLPSVAELARTTGEKQIAVADIDKQIAALRAQKDGLFPNAEVGGFDVTNSNPQKDQTTDSIDDTVEELMKHTRAELVEKAAALGLTIGDTETKTHISEAILAKQAEQKS